MSLPSADIFISYARLDPDAAVARHLEARLRMIGFRVWRDESSLSLGADVDSTIFGMIDRARAVVGVLSERAMGRDFIEREWERGRDRLFLLRLDATPVPDRHKHRHATKDVDDLIGELRTGATGCCELGLRLRDDLIELSSAREVQELRAVPSALHGALPAPAQTRGRRPRSPPSHPFEARVPDVDPVGDALAEVLGLHDVPISLRLSIDSSLLAFPWSALRMKGRRLLGELEIGLELSDVEQPSWDRRRASPSRLLWISPSPPSLDSGWTVLSSADAIERRLIDFDAFPTHPEHDPAASLFVIDDGGGSGPSPDFAECVNELALAYRPLCVILRCSFQELRKPRARALARHGATLCHIPSKQDADICANLVGPAVSGGVEALRAAARRICVADLWRPWLWPTVFAPRGDRDVR